MDLGISGLASGFDWNSLVDQLTNVERAPQTRLRTEQSKILQKNNALGSIKTQLSTLKTRVEALKDPDLFESRTAASSDTTLATTTAATGAALGSYKFTVTQLATTSVSRGAADAGSALAATDDVSALTLSNAGFATAVTAGTFTVNGKQVTIDTSDTLQGVFDKINTATGGVVTATYSAATDKINLSSTGGEIVLGSATDSSNFLQVAKLANNGGSSVTSSASLGGVKLTGTASSANLATTLSDGGSGVGEFKINGVSISFDASADSISAVLARINNSTAGVTASYDSVNDRFTLSNKNTGDMGIALEDVTGNFLAATGLSSGTLTRGKNLLYTINDGGELSSQSNTITDSSSGITGLSVSMLKEGTVDVTVASDTSKIKTAITDFLSEYTKAQSVIDSQTASSTDASGKVTASVLANDTFASDLARTLRSTAYSSITGLSGTLNHLASLGIASSGTDNSLTLSDSEKLDDALTNNLSSVKDLFTNSTSGIAVSFDSYLDSTIGDSGTLIEKQDKLTKDSSSIDTQVADQERLVQSNRQRLIDGFVAMEEAQAKINQQLQFLTKRFG